MGNLPFVTYYMLLLLGLTMSPSLIAADPTISVEARQRYPWNGLVDLNFTITGTSGTKYDTSFTAKDMVGNTNITMATIRKADGSAANVAKEQLLPGTYNWVWDAAADLPKEFQCDRVTVTGAAEEHKYLYMVINLSGGSSASSYPVSYLDAVPSGGWGDTYKKTKLVLRRVTKGTNPAGGSMSKDMWVGVFEVTEGQYAQVTKFSVGGGGAMAAAYCLYQGSTGAADLSDTEHMISALKAKTVLKKCRLPTRKEWEYACRAGTQTAYNNGTNASAENMNKVGWWNGNCTSSSGLRVGQKVPNAWGLYDMHGNIREWTSQSYCSMGGSFRSNYNECTSSSSYDQGDFVGRITNGFRVFAEIDE